MKQHNAVLDQQQKVALEKTKIEMILKKAKKEYDALVPAWANDEKTEVKYWLNPKDQENVNYGWYSLQDLKLWAKNKGRIPKASTTH